MRKRLSVVVADGKASGLLFYEPRRREAAGGHSRVGLIPVPSYVQKDRDQRGQQTHDHRDSRPINVRSEVGHRPSRQGDWSSPASTMAASFFFH